MDFTTGSPSQEALSQLIESLTQFILREGLPMTQTLANPRQITHWHQRFDQRSRGEKFYRTGFQFHGGISQFSRRKFRTASEAETYGARLLIRWMRLYDAAVITKATAPGAEPEAVTGREA